MDQRILVESNIKTDWKDKVEHFPLDSCIRIETELKNYEFSQLGFISEGDQGLILKAFSKRHQSQVALKISQNSKFCFDQLQKEYEIIKSIKGSTNIVYIYEILFIENSYISIIILELCQKSLFDEMKELEQAKNWFSNEEMTNIILQLSHALTQIHCYKIIHADIKPQNILKSLDGTYKLCDFGLAQKISSQQSEISKTKGQTLKYDSPEQQQKQENNNNTKQEDITCNISYQTDVFSAGLVILEILGYKLTISDAKSISDNNYKQLENINNFRFPQIFDLLKNKFFQINPRERIESYEIIYTLLPLLPYSQKNLNQMIPIIENVEKQDTFDNSKHISYILNIQLFYQLTLIFILDKFPNTSPKKKADAFSLAAWVLTEKGQYIKSNIFRKQALQLYNSIKPNQNEDIIQQLQQMCYNFKCLQQYRNSLKFGLKALKLSKKVYKGNNCNIARSMIEVAWCYRVYGEDKKGLELAHKAYATFCSFYGISFHKDIGDALTAIASMSSGLKKYEESIDYYKKAIHVFQKVYNYQEHPDIAICFENMGVAYENLKEYDMSLLFYEDSLQMKKLIFGNYSLRLCSTFSKLARVLRLLRREEEAHNIEKQHSEILRMSSI